MTFYTRGLALDSRHPRFIPLRIADRRPHVVVAITARLSPVVRYHGLARRYLTPPRFLMRPLLNGGTLGRQRADRNFARAFFRVRAGSLTALWRARQRRVDRREHERAGCTASVAVVATGGVAKQDRARKPLSGLRSFRSPSSRLLSRRQNTSSWRPQRVRPGAKPAD